MLPYKECANNNKWPIGMKILSHTKFNRVKVVVLGIPATKMLPKNQDYPIFISVGTKNKNLT